MYHFKKFTTKLIQLWYGYISRCPECLRRWNKIQDVTCPHCELKKIWIEEEYFRVAD